MRIAAALLESYERQVQSVEGALKVVTLLSTSCHPLVTLLSTSCHPLVALLSPSCHLLVTLLSPSTFPLEPLSLPSLSLLLSICTVDVDVSMSRGWYYPLTESWSTLVLCLQHDGSTDTLHRPVHKQLHGQRGDPMCCSLMMTLIVVATTINNHCHDRSSKQWRWQ